MGGEGPAVGGDTAYDDADPGLPEAGGGGGGGDAAVVRHGRVARVTAGRTVDAGAGADPSARRPRRTEAPPTR